MIYATFLILGLAAGAVYASIGIGIVITYRSSGVLNFATGAIGLYVAYVFAALQNDGAYLQPIPGLTPEIHLAKHLPLPLDYVLALGTGVVLCVLLYLGIFRRLRNALPLTKVVASIGVMIVLQNVIGLQVGTNPVSVLPIFPGTPLHLGAFVLTVDRLYLSAIVICVAVVVWAILKFTRFGLATRAISENEKGAVSLGLSPNYIAIINWAFAGFVVGLLGILIAPDVPLVPSEYTLFIVAGLAAALAGRLSALIPTLVVGFAIGMLQSEMALFQTKWPSFPGSGVGATIPMVVILVVLMVRGNAIPGRGEFIKQALPFAPKPRHPLILAGILAAAGVVAILLLQGEWLAALITTMIYIVVALSWTVVTGYAGQPTFAQLTIAGVSAFLLSRVATSMGIAFPWCLFLSTAAAAAVCVFTGIPAVRVRGANLAVLSLGAATAIEAIYFTNFSWNGGNGGATVNGPTFLGINLEIGAGGAYPRIAFALFCLLVVLLSGLGVAALRRGQLGAKMLAVRSNERAAAAAGINVVRVKLAALLVAGTLAGLGGGLLGYQLGNITDDSFGALISLSLFAVVYLAGITSISGAMVAGVIAPGGMMYLVFNQYVNLGVYYQLLAGVMLVFATITTPEGIVSVHLHRIEARRERRLVSRPGIGPLAGSSPVTAPYFERT